MDFKLSKEQRDIVKAARKFARGELKDIARDCDIKEEFPRSLIKTAAELGFIGVFIPETYGGAGLGFLEHALIMEEMWRVDPGLGQCFTGATFGSEEVLLFGSEEQKKKCLPPLVQGNALTGFAITEPNAGSDACSAATSALLQGDEYIINGSKVMIGNGSVADFLMVFCRTDPNEGSRGKRHSILLVETKRDGYKANRIEGKMGIRASDTANIYFTNVRVPMDNLVGKRGHGWAQLMAFFDRSRSYVAAHGVGLAQGALDLAIEHVKNREQFGQKIASFQVTHFKVAEMATKIELARTLTHKACWTIDHDEGDSRLVAMAKWFAGRTAVEVVDEALQMHGGYGYINEHDIERFYRAAKVLEIYEGTREVEKILIGRSLLGRD